MTAVLKIRLYHKLLLTTVAIILTAGGFSVVEAGTPEVLFDVGSKAYLDGDWKEALDNWQQVENSGYYSGSLYYNIGNAYFKLNRIGMAILYWERAKRVLGNDEDNQANLDIARQHLVDKQDELVKLPVWKLFDDFRSTVGIKRTVWSSLLFSLLLFLCWGLSRWIWRVGSPNRWIKRLTWLFTFLVIVDLSLITIDARDRNMRREGVLIVSEAAVYSAPAEGSGKLLFSLHEGTKVRVIRILKDWYEIELGSDKKGWIGSDQLEII